MKRTFWFILFILLVCSSIWSWNEDVLLASSHYKDWEAGALGIGAVYSCWQESVDSSYVIKIQGMDLSGEDIWDEPAEISQNALRTDYYQIICGEDGAVFISWCSYQQEWTPECIYIQKINDNGELLWEEPGTMMYYNTTNYTLESDRMGGVYLIENNTNSVRAWHLDSDGATVAGWEYGIELGTSYWVDYEITEAGDIAILRNPLDREPGMYFQILQGDGSYYYAGNGIWCFDSNEEGAELEIRPSGGYLFAAVFEGSVYGNVMLSDEEFLYEEAVILGEEGEGALLPDMKFQGGSCNLTFTNWQEHEIDIWQYNEDLEFQYSNPGLYFDRNIDNIQYKPNGNVLIIEGYNDDLVIREYNSVGNLISPEDGWFASYYGLDYIGGNDAGDCYLMRELYSSASEKNIRCQGLNIESEPIFEGDGHLIFQSIQLSPRKCEIITQSDRTILCWWECENNWLSYRVQYLDEEGNPLLPDGGLVVISKEVQYSEFKTLIIEDNSIIFCEIDHNWMRSDESCNLHKIVFDEEPYLAWGEDGIELSEDRGIHPEAIKRGEDNYFIYWGNSSNIMCGQLLVDGEFQLPADYSLGVNYNEIISVTGNYCVYKSPSSINVIHWSENLDWDWEEPVLLTARSYFDGDSFAFLSEGNLVIYWLSYERAQMTDYSWRIKKQVITPAGEKLLPQYGDQVYDNGEDEIRKFYYLEDTDQILLLCGSRIEFRIRYMSKEGIVQNDDYICISGLDGRTICDIYTENGYLLVQSIFFDEETCRMLGLAIFDFEGNSVEGLPGVDIGVHKDYYNFANIVGTEEGIYYIWCEYPTQSTEYSGDKLYAQKLTFNPAQENESEIDKPFYDLTAYPNPFNPQTTITFSLSETSDVKLFVYNIKGQKVKTLLKDKLEYGTHSVVWSGDDELGRKASSGVYFFQLKIDRKTEKVKKCLLLK
ncbi:MAG: T9SS type A sorting domain-containing protein [Candidatus Stygibacter australis]|nr:T9SS type A sorting domain-containing protein [Candidatus Stygibacter australis]